MFYSLPHPYADSNVQNIWYVMRMMIARQRGGFPNEGAATGRRQARRLKMPLLIE
jgi:hypothetical protein